MSPQAPSTADWTPEQRAAFFARRASRNRALGVLLFTLVALFFGITVVRMTGQKPPIPAAKLPPPIAAPAQ